MSILNIWFLGIVTHVFRDSTEPNAGDLRATVCVNWPIANNLPLGDAIVEIPAHVPRLHVAEDDIVGDVPPFFRMPVNGIYRWGLTGVEFLVVNVEGGLTESGNWPEIASLSALTPGIGPIDRKVVIDTNPAYSAMHFDTTGGEFSAFKTDQNAIVALLNTSTLDGLGEPVTLRITPYGNDSVDLKIRDGATISIVNDAVDSDSPNDFLLHYLCVTPFPQNPGIPPSETIPELPLAVRDRTWPTRFSVGPGCSNSTYP